MPEQTVIAMKRLVFCFDGSWNRLDAKHPTNVVFTAENIRPVASDGVTQYVFYDEGVGTDGDRFVGGVFGAGLLKNLADAYRALIFNHTPGDEIYIFGFSRGAFSARSFAGLIRTCGILQRVHASRANEAVELYKDRDDSLLFTAKIHVFRNLYAPDVCVSAEEDAWRAANVSGYRPAQSPVLAIRYIGVWDTVGALGIPKYIWASKGFNKQYQFHDTKLSAFVQYARHAVAIDERRVDFEPTLWDNLEELNMARGKANSAADAPYQQKWFPGVHGSVGGGGDRRGLSDQTLAWIWEGAQRTGLEFNPDTQRSFAPSFREYLNNNSAPAQFNVLGELIKHMPQGDRLPGPHALHEVSQSAQQRWHEPAKQLMDKTLYRPRTLDGVAAALDMEKGKQSKPGDKQSRSPA